ncbi:MAG: GFA family protein [Reyranella sp.]|jgi:hypothetical protein|nr:GFA family protein [Reyranella sp.]
MKKTYHGSCHCGWLRFEADIDLEAGTGRCNCSICTKQRAWNAVIKPQGFRLLSGQDNPADYQFGSKQGHHRFCKTCGIAAFGEGYVEAIGGAFVSVNVACLDDIAPEELANVPIRYMDGRHDNWFEPPNVTSYL